MNETQVEILVEEPSMEYFLRGILPRILPSSFQLDIDCFIRPHQGKQDLQKSIIRKVQTYPFWSRPIRLIIVHDQDSNDCVQLKQQLVQLARSTNASLPLLVRIACRELENWYLGDLNAVECVYPDSRASRLIGQRKYADPDRLTGSNEMERLTNSFSKSYAAREMPRYMQIEENTSRSFRQFISGVRNFLNSHV